MRMVQKYIYLFRISYKIRLINLKKLNENQINKNNEIIQKIVYLFIYKFFNNRWRKKMKKK